jgi:hypothetical protein
VGHLTQTNRSLPDIATKQELVPGLPPATRIYVTNGIETCALLTPNGYQLDGTIQNWVQLVNEKYDCFMTFRIIKASPEKKSQLDTYYRVLLSDRYPDVKILGEFSQEAGGLSGKAFDLEWRGHANVTRASRVVFVPSPTGIFEFSLVCDPDKFQQVQNDFHCLLLTFRVGENGKLKIVPRSDSI